MYDVDWKDETVFIIGGGPSLKTYVPDIDVLKDKKCIAVNNAYQLAPFSPIMIFADHMWYGWHKETLKEFNGIKFCGAWGGNKKQYDESVIYLDRIKKDGLDFREGFICGNNTGYQAINLAINLGAKEIVLIGFDMGFDDKGNSNWHDDHKRKGRAGIYEDTMIPTFQSINDVLKDSNKDVTIYNINSESNLKTFKFKKIEEFL